MTTHNISSAADLTPLAFPPIPLASGDALVDVAGARRPITNVDLLITVEDATGPVSIPLTFHLGGWWAPPAPAPIAEPAEPVGAEDHSTTRTG